MHFPRCSMEVCLCLNLGHVQITWKCLLSARRKAGIKSFGTLRLILKEQPVLTTAGSGSSPAWAGAEPEPVMAQRTPRLGSRRVHITGSLPVTRSKAGSTKPLFTSTSRTRKISITLSYIIIQDLCARLLRMT